jgi:hypothetical protein
MREGKRLRASLSLDDISESLEELLAVETLQASPKYRSLVEGRKKYPKLRVKAHSLLRDTLKITGFEEANFQPAQIAVFNVNSGDTGKGGTEPTVRVCENRQVLVLTPDLWMH